LRESAAEAATMNKATIEPHERNTATRLSPETEAAVREGAEQADRGELADLSPEENELYLDTGELPERVKRWVYSHGTRRGS
jgi:hypothetical protein